MFSLFCPLVKIVNIQIAFCSNPGSTCTILGNEFYIQSIDSFHLYNEGDTYFSRCYED